MKTLYLVRHAKSSWAIEEIADKDRPLKGRGIRDAHMISKYLCETMTTSLNIQLCSSSATRALHTALIFAQNFGIPAGQIRVVDELYHCEWDSIHDEVKRTDDEVDVLFLFAHNPGITEYVNEIADAGIENVPTTGVVGIEFDSNSWSTIAKEGKCMLFEYPKRLK
jgi:phosphohistidine phosphatase